MPDKYLHKFKNVGHKCPTYLRRCYFCLLDGMASIGSLKTQKYRFQAAFVFPFSYRSIKFSPSSRCNRAKIKPENRVKPPIAKNVQRNAVCTLPAKAGSVEK